MSSTCLSRRVVAGCLSAWLSFVAVASAQSSGPQTGQQAPSDNSVAMSGAASPATATSRVAATPPGYVIGPDDVLAIVFWREKDLSAEVVVRPDGMITLPLLEDIKVAGLTPAELKRKVTAEAGNLVTSPSVSVIVKQINSRKVFITGHVARPGSYPLTAPMSVMQLIALSGGLLEFADRAKIRVMRVDKLGPETHLVNYKQLANGVELKQNIDLKPGDTVIVP